MRGTHIGADAAPHSQAKESSCHAGDAGIEGAHLITDQPWVVGLLSTLKSNDLPTGSIELPSGSSSIELPSGMLKRASALSPSRSDSASVTKYSTASFAFLLAAGCGVQSV
mmetsp:Transcript_27247/g.69259  ORF Transcript_27247/g.69259 Transcript_27247/m.69259 type:complete len:111 (-) Transcript_27247:1126-1458(-)